MTESARDEALRLAREAFPVVYRGPLGSPELAFTIEGAMELIALSRQRSGWVWVPEEPTIEMIYKGYMKITQCIESDSRDIGPCYRAMLAATPKQEEGT
jgi:hypothetical protein